MSLFSSSAVPILGNPSLSGKNNRFDIKRANKFLKEKKGLVGNVLAWKQSLNWFGKKWNCFDEFGLKQMPRNKSCTCMAKEHLLVKMATSSQQSAFTENKIVKFRGRVCLIVKIDRQLGFSRISVVDVDTGHQMAAFGYELELIFDLAATQSSSEPDARQSFSGCQSSFVWKNS